MTAVLGAALTNDPGSLPSVRRLGLSDDPAEVAKRLLELHGQIRLPCLANLWQFQAGYRWNGLTGEPIEDWNDDWLVVADEGGDPFIFARSSGVILHAYHGEGEWEAGEIFSDLKTMAACLAQIGAIVVESGREYMEEDCSIRPKYRSLASDRLQSLLGSKSQAEAILAVLGWG